MNLLKQSTAATIKLGPFVDDTDGKTAETALTIGQADIRLSKNGGDIAQTNNSAGATHDELGYYNVPLDVTDTSTLGRLQVAVSVSGALPVWKEFLVVTANVYDTLCSTDSLDVNVTALAPIKVSIDAIKAKTDALGISAVNFVTVVNGSTITIMRGDTLDDGTLTDLGDLTDYVSIDFTVKESYSDTDDEAIIRIRKNASGIGDGLIRLNGAAYTTGTDGSITITDMPTGDVTIMLKAGVTDDLVPGSYVYDIQLIEAAGVTTLTTGDLVVTADVTRLVA